MPRKRIPKEKRKQIAHIVAGFVILIHAFERYESGHGIPLFFAIAGLIFLSLAFFHHTISKKFPWVDGVFFIIESALSLVIAFEYIHAGKKALPYSYFIIAGFQLFMAIKLSRRGMRQHRMPSDAIE